MLNRAVLRTTGTQPSTSELISQGSGKAEEDQFLCLSAGEPLGGVIHSTTRPVGIVFHSQERHMLAGVQAQAVNAFGGFVGDLQHLDHRPQLEKTLFTGQSGFVI